MTNNYCINEVEGVFSNYAESVRKINIQEAPVYMGLEAGNYYDYKAVLGDAGEYGHSKLLEMCRNANGRYYHLKSCYILINEDEIFEFINNDDKYMELLLQIPKQLRYYLDYHRIYVELLNDFEEQEPPKLRITILSKFGLIESHSRLKKFNILWFLNRFDPLDYRIVFSLFAI
jgi:hypothetical protein